jgi:acetyl-CoA synthetase
LVLRVLEHYRGRSIEEIREEFRWEIPACYNIGVDCADRQPRDRVAMVHVEEDGSTQELRYRDLSQLSNRLANVLEGLGLVPRDRVAVILPQGPKLAISHLAVYKMGGVAVPLTVLFGPDAIRVRLQDSGARLVITDRATAEKIEDIKVDLPNLKRVLVVESDWEPLLSQATDLFAPRTTTPREPALLIYTSGTTGGPKGALHGQQILLGHLPGFELCHDFYGQAGDRFWTPADWAWIGGLFDALFPVLHHGSSILSLASSGPFDPERSLMMMARHGVRNTFLPPTALKLMRRADVRAPAELRLRTVMCGGEPLGDEILDWTRERLGVTISEMYGQTECNYVIGNAQTLYPVHPGSMGRAYVGHRVDVLDSAGNPTSDLGQIAVRRPDPVMFLGYWHNAEATRAKFEGEWLLTGDVAAKDAEGYFWFKGRIDDVISSAGYRIGPSEIENCLLRHPAVAMAAVIGVPDSIRGQIVKAYIVLRPVYSPSQDLETEIQQLVRSRLAAYQYPRELEFISELPLTTTGKIRRNELRKLHEGSGTLPA